MAKIYLVRHCRVGGQCLPAHTGPRGRSWSRHNGYEQCEMLRRRFEGIHIDKLYSSDSYRSIMTIRPHREGARPDDSHAHLAA